MLGLGGCATVPEPIQIPENTRLVEYEQVINSPEAVAVLGEKARWGGRIVGVQNKAEVSEIEVVFFPESSNGKPQTSQQSEGRFKAIVPGFVDPLVFEKDRLITIVGEVSEPVVGIIGEQNYTYPTLNAVGYFMWKQTSDVQIQNIGFEPFLFGPRFGVRGFHPWYSPWYSPWHNGFHHSRVRVIRNNGHSQGGRASYQRSRTNQTVGSGTPSRGSQPASVQKEDARNLLFTRTYRCN